MKTIMKPIRLACATAFTFVTLVIPAYAAPINPPTVGYITSLGGGWNVPTLLIVVDMPFYNPENCPFTDAYIIPDNIPANQLLTSLAITAYSTHKLVDPSAAFLPVRPEASLKHPEPQRLASNRNAVDLTELLRRQGGPEIRIALTDHRQRLRLEAFWHLPVARSAALLGYKGSCALVLIGLGQVLDLPALQSQKLGSRRRRQPTARQIRAGLQAAPAPCRS